ncbi:phenylalanine--tRNA ligase subunit alpha [Betaproteobacteria bacterium]|nr:phenylalanine--tRNA ligase subunit alpha [Betaproteobacteria bacterium]
MKPDLQLIVSQAEAEFKSANSLHDLDNAKSLFLGKNGKLAILFQKLKSLESDQKKILGHELNLVKQQIENILLKSRKQIIDSSIRKKLESQSIDISLPGRGINKGSVHPLTQSLRRIQEIFYGMGFEIAEGPEIETDWFNFTALNNPMDHPARSMQDTFYIEHKDEHGQNLLLRTHTSPVQVRYSINHNPPIRVISPGKTYRVDSDATHSPMFHQIEGLWLDPDINFSSLKGVYINFLKEFFDSSNLTVRFRPSYFPFTEPSAEIDLKFSEGPLEGKWLEVAGAGMVHPNVIENFGLNSKKIRGFAFGMGLERLTMLKFGVKDLRLFFDNDLRFLEQFKC